MRYGRRQHLKAKNVRLIHQIESDVLRYRLSCEAARRNRRALGLPEVAFVDLSDDERQVYYAGVDALLARPVPSTNEEAAHVYHV